MNEQSGRYDNLHGDEELYSYKTEKYVDYACDHYLSLYKDEPIMDKTNGKGVTS